jgi:very-long-chain (3R)-3-hydroxyacyl-CoA dehydratase
MSAIKTGYLALYNAAAAAGWAYFIFEIVQYYQKQLAKGVSFEHLNHADLYATVHPTLDIVQTSAILEIVHSALGLVKSPIATTFLQGKSIDVKYFRHRPFSESPHI